MEGQVLKKWIRPILLGTICILWASSPSFSQTPEDKTPISVLKIEVGDAPAGVRVTIEGSRPFEYSVTKAMNPLRLVIDLPEARDGSFKDPIMVKNGTINTIYHKANADLGKAGARVEIGLDQSVEYNVNSEGPRLFVDLGRPIAAPAQAKPRKGSATAQASSAVAPPSPVGSEKKRRACGTAEAFFFGQIPERSGRFHPSGLGGGGSLWGWEDPRIQGDASYQASPSRI